MKTAATTTIQDARKQAKETLADAQKQARSTVKDARKQAGRQLVQARVAATRVRSRSRAKASGVSAKAVGAAGAAGLAAGYLLDPESGRRRRHEARDRALAAIRLVKNPSGTEKPAADDRPLADPVKSEVST
jgi:F0F1-type ATP synthase membrane subunit b/b'